MTHSGLEAVEVFGRMLYDLADLGIQNIAQHANRYQDHEKGKQHENPGRLGLPPSLFFSEIEHPLAHEHIKGHRTQEGRREEPELPEQYDAKEKNQSYEKNLPQ